MCIVILSVRRVKLYNKQSKLNGSFIIIILYFANNNNNNKNIQLNICFDKLKNFHNNNNNNNNIYDVQMRQSIHKVVVAEVANITHIKSCHQNYVHNV